MVEIRRWTDDAVLWRSSAATLAESVEEAVRNGAPLREADLRGAKLVRTRLDRAELYGARLDDASLAEASMVGAVLDGATLNMAILDRARLDDARISDASLINAQLYRASLVGARLCDSQLHGARLYRANLTRADFCCANLCTANLDGVTIVETYFGGARLDGATFRDVSPPMFLLANWGAVSDELCRDLMRLDASCHPDPAAFDRWAADGQCPYNCVSVCRAARFFVRRELWSPGPPPSIFELVQRILAEKGCRWP